MDDHKPARPDIDALMSLDDPAGSERKYRELLAAPSAAKDAGWNLELRCVIARTFGLRGKFAEAHAMLDEVEKELTPDLKRAHIRYLLERGRTLNSSGKPAESVPLFLKAFDEAKAAREEYLAIDAAHMVAIAGPPEKQIEWGLKGLEMAEKSKDQKARKWAGALTNNLGWTYHDTKQYDRALDMFKRGVRVREEMKQPKELRIAKYAVGRCLRSLSRIDEALAIQQAIHKESEAAGSSDPYVCEELGELLLLKHRDAEAAPYFAAAYKELSKDDWLVKNEAARLERMKRLGKAERRKPPSSRRNN